MTAYRGLAEGFWTRLHGIVSLGLAGHFNGMNINTRQMYDREVERAFTDDL